ncbi:MAG TPA: hypothetical protein ENK19_07675 [Acidobacteria bacterium]|nr:hypothetical protein [Acidobacteriota bacterium]
MWIVPLGWLAATRARYPVSGGNEDGRRLIDALLELSEAEVLDDEGDDALGHQEMAEARPAGDGDSGSATPWSEASCG